MQPTFLHHIDKKHRHFQAGSYKKRTCGKGSFCAQECSFEWAHALKISVACETHYLVIANSIVDFEDMRHIFFYIDKLVRGFVFRNWLQILFDYRVFHIGSYRTDLQIEVYFSKKRFSYFKITYMRWNKYATLSLVEEFIQVFDTIELIGKFIFESCQNSNFINNSLSKSKVIEVEANDSFKRVISQAMAEIVIHIAIGAPFK